jgi:hypothetical protein
MSAGEHVPGEQAVPVVRDWVLQLDVDAVLRAEGAEPDRLRARSAASVAVAAAALEVGLPLLAPVVAYRQLTVVGFRHQRVLLEGHGVLRGPLIAEHLHAARAVAVLVCTIGSALERQASSTFAGDPALGLALDSLGSAAVGALTGEACRWVDRQASEHGWQSTVPLSPGLIGWPVDPGQREVFGLVDAGAAGVTLSDGLMMRPHKSNSVVIGLGPDVRHAGEPCDYCSVKDTCRYRGQQSHHG